MGGKERRVAGLNAIDAIIPVVAVLVRRRTFWTITSRRISRLVLNWLCWSWDVISIGHLAQTAATRFYISGNRNTNIYKSVGVFLKCTIIASSSSYCPLFFPAFDSTLSACRARGQELDFFFFFFLNLLVALNVLSVCSRPLSGLLFVTHFSLTWTIDSDTHKRRKGLCLM